MGFEFIPPPYRPPAPLPPLPADPFAREEAWIASGTGETFHEFVAQRTQLDRDRAMQIALRTPSPDPGIYLWR